MKPRTPVELGETVSGTRPASEEAAAHGSTNPALTGLRQDGPRYAERKLIGRGGMGEVYLRRDEWLGRDVAVKTLTAERSSLGVARARFLREARVQGQLEHPAIVPVYDVGVDEHGHEYFTMKRITGRTLEEIFTARDFPRSRLLGLFRQVCLAVDYAHARGVVHRDLKPANVMIGSYGEVYVLDWGLAKVVGMASGIEERPAGAAGETLSGHVLGTPGYMAPEQIDSANDADDRADVYALGCILFELLAGDPLHRGKSPQELLRSTQEDAPGSPSERAPDADVPPELDALCASATARDPARRTTSARHIADAIERFLEGDRDLAARRALGLKHAEAAAVAAREALGGGSRAIEARARALKDAGRAMTLDPENAAGAATLLQLLAQPPAVLPEEVRAEIERGDREAMRLRNRKGLGMFVVFLIGVLSLPLCGVRSWGLIACILAPLLGALALTIWVLRARDLTIERFERRTDWVVGMAFAAVACVSLGATSNVIVPVLALTFAIGAAVASRPGRRLRYMGIGLAAFLVPFLLEWSHLLPAILPGLQFVRGGAFIPASVIDLPEFPTRIIILLATCGSMVAPSFTVLPVLDAAAATRTESFLQAWHLRQLAPSEPLRRAGTP
jgi:tRNA A-37 threonylcarbamoyl transferase component Bud32